MTLRPEIAAAIDAHPSRAVRTAWRHDDVATVTRDLLAKARKLHRAVTPEEVADLMRTLAVERGPHHTDTVNIGWDGKQSRYQLRVGGREIYFEGDRFYSSCDIPGLYAHNQMPRQPEAHAQARDQINALLAAHGVAPQVVGAAPMPVRHHEQFETTLLTIVTPERKGTWELNGEYAHAPAAHRLEVSQRHVRHILLRIQHRRRIQRERLEAEQKVAEAISHVEGMRVVGSQYNIETWRTGLPTGHMKGTAYALVEVVDDRLKRSTVVLGVPKPKGHKDHDDDVKWRKSRIARHRANLKRLADQDQGGALVCEPILAAALRAAKPRFAPDLIAEIEAAMDGAGRNPANPRLRGIANFSIVKGMLKAPVTLARGARFMKDRVNVGSIKQLPDTLLTGAKGRPIRQIVDHPFLEGLTVQTIMINSKGLQIRPAVPDKPVRLADVLADLRRIAGDTE